MEKLLFIESLENHQAVIDHILKYKNDDGICRVKQAQLMLETGRHWTWIAKAIKRINTEEVCIEKLGTSEYRIIHADLLQHGVFTRILEMLLDTITMPEIVKMKDRELMDRYHCSLKTVQMYRAYVTSGWKVKLKEAIENGQIDETKLRNYRP